MSFICGLSTIATLIEPPPAPSPESESLAAAADGDDTGDGQHGRDRPMAHPTPHLVSSS